jgi:hypothetical protein
LYIVLIALFWITCSRFMLACEVLENMEDA